MKHLSEMVRERCRIDSEKTAFLVKENNTWNPVFWSEVDEQVEKIAAGLLSLGLKPGDTVSILGNTRLEWTLSDLGVLRIGGISVGIYQTLSDRQITYILKDSGSKVLIVEDKNQIEKIKPHLDDLPELKWIILWDGTPEGTNQISFTSLKKKGAEKLSGDPDCVIQAENRINPLDTAIIIYTSGTTGPPKGACLSHKNILAEFESVDIIEAEKMGNTMMFFLPLSHVGERVAGQYMRIYRGITAAYVKDITRILDDMKEIRPTFFGSVPRIFEKAYARIQTEAAAASPVKQKLFNWAESIGRQVSRNKQAGNASPPLLNLQNAIADRLVFRKIRDIFGGKVRYFLSSSAPIALEIIEFFHACGMLILEGYGQTEVSCFCTLCTPDEYRFGSVGKALSGVELKFADDGEVMVKGEIVFKGYLNQPDLNKKTLTDDGWIYTGDIGRLDEDGYLWITGRKKEIIITSGGKNVTPSNIENLIKNHPLIEHAMVHGDRRKYLTALISLDQDNLMAWAEKNEHSGLDFETLTHLPEIREMVQKVVDESNKSLAKFETIKKFIIIPKPFLVDTGELTPTMKVRRSIVEDKYMPMLNTLYDE